MGVLLFSLASGLQCRLLGSLKLLQHAANLPTERLHGGSNAGIGGGLAFGEQLAHLVNECLAARGKRAHGRLGLAGVVCLALLACSQSGLLHCLELFEHLAHLSAQALHGRLHTRARIGLAFGQQLPDLLDECLAARGQRPHGRFRLAGRGFFPLLPRAQGCLLRGLELVEHDAHLVPDGLERALHLGSGLVLGT